MQHARILILDVDSEGEIERVARGRWDVMRAPDVDAAVQIVSRHSIFVVITHLRDSQEENHSRITRLRSAAPGVKVFVLGDSLDLLEVVHAINEYRVDRILSSPVDARELAFHLETAQEQFEFHCLDFSDFRLGIAEQNRRVLCVDDDGDILNFYQEVLCPRVNDRLGEIFDRRMRRRGLAAAGPNGAPPPSRASLPMLGLLPLEVTVANSGEQAVKLVQEAIAEGRPFSAGFFDMKMPGGIDGLETIRRIREIDPSMMCAVVTAYTDRTLTEIQQVFSEEAEWMYFNKPFTETELQQAASNLVHGWNHRRRMESTEKFSSKLRYLFYKQRFMYSVLDVETLVKTVCLKTVFEVLGADGGALVLMDWSSRRCEIAAMDGLGDQGSELIQSIASWVGKNEGPAILDAATADRPLAEQLARHQVRTALSVPLVGEEGVIGSITATFSMKARKFSKEDLEILIILADHMETAIRNAQRVHSLRADVDSSATVKDVAC